MAFLDEFGGGIKNLLVGLSGEEVMIVEDRLRECMDCSLGGVICSGRGIAVRDFDYGGEKREKGVEYSGCNCIITIKVKSFGSSCPLGKWLKVEK